MTVAIICDVCSGPLSYKSKLGVCSRNEICERERKRRTAEIYRERLRKKPEEYKEYVKEWNSQARRRRSDNPIVFLLRNIRYRATKKNLPFSLTKDNIPPVPKKCPILDMPLIAPLQGPRKDNSASLDRIINHGLGYVPENVQWISYRANDLKKDATLEELVLLGEWAAKQLANQATIEVNERIA